MPPGTATEGDDGPPRLTLPEACRTGVLNMSIDAARKARERDPEFPTAIGTGRNQTHDTAALEAYARNRAVRGGTQ